MPSMIGAMATNLDIASPTVPSDTVAAPPAPVAAVACSGLRRTYGPVVALDGIDLEVAEGELLAVLGPSGCGKTTLLRLIAGFEPPDAGTISLAGQDVAGPDRSVPPERRRVGIVVQDHALFPHLTVAANVGYGLRGPNAAAGLRGPNAVAGLHGPNAVAGVGGPNAVAGLRGPNAVAGLGGPNAVAGLAGRRRRHDPARTARIAEVLAMVGMPDLGGRYPAELSGGQQQRVAIARALAPEPGVVLLDEPFANLDAALRARIRQEVAAILRAAGATVVLVTHDQEEALSLADRVAVLNAGRLAQVGPPDEVYRNPADPFVARFVGDADLVEGHSDGAAVDTPIGRLAVTGAVPPAGPALAVVRPEAVRLAPDPSSPARVTSATYFGHDQLVQVALDGALSLRARVGNERLFAPGDRVSLGVDGGVVAFPA